MHSPLLPETILPQRGWCSLSPAAATGFVVCAGRGRQGHRSPSRAGPTPAPTRHRHGQSLPGGTEGGTPPAMGTRRTLPGPPSACRACPCPAPPAQPGDAQHRGRSAGWGWAAPRPGSPARESQRKRSRAEPCQASIPALSRPPPQGSLNMNRPFNLLRRLEGLAAGLLAGTHSPAVGTVQSCSRQGLPPTLPAQGIPKPAPLPALGARGPQSRETIPVPPGAHSPHRAALGLQHQPQFDLLMAFDSALNWVGKRHVSYPKSSLIALHGAGHRVLAGGSPGTQTLWAN